MSMRSLAMHCWLALGILGLNECLARVPRQAVPLLGTSSAQAAESPAPQAIDDAPQPFTPAHAKTETDSDRVEALSLFAAGRTHEQREEFADALRCYERALRLDPQSSAIIRAILPPAVRLKRYDEAARYVLKAADLKGANPLQLAEVGVSLKEQGDFARASAVCRKALAACDKPAVTIVLQNELGDLYWIDGAYKQAADCFAAVLDAIDHPDKYGLDESLKNALLGEPSLTFQKIGDCFLAADRRQEAKAVFERSEMLACDKARRQFNLARVYAETGKPAEALAAFESAFAEPASNEFVFPPYEALARVLKELGKGSELIGRLEKLQLSRRDDLPLRYFLASQYKSAGKLDAAESLYRELLKIKPMTDGYRALLDLDRQSKRFDALLAAMGESVEKLGVMRTLDAEARSVCDDAEAMRGVVETARKKLKSSPDKFGYGERLAAALLTLEAKQYATAGEFFDAALATKPKKADKAFLAWGVALLADGRAAEAAKVFRRAINAEAARDDDPVFHFYLADALAVVGQTDDALAAARIAAEKKKDSARFRGRPAWVLSLAKRNDKAAKAYRELLDQFDADRDSAETRDVMREARLTLSNLAVIKGDLPQAEQWLEQVLDEFPDDKGAMNDLAYLWADQNKNLARARRMIEAAVGAEPDNMAYRDSLGWVLFRQGKYAEAVVELQKAAADKKPDGMVLDHLGDAYQKANQRGKAVEAWRNAAELLRKEKEMDKAVSVQKKIRQIAN
jgi:tetratricopeptide (TPR) repeat protein